MIVRVSSRGYKDATGKTVHKHFGDLCISNWIWAAVKSEAAERGVSEHMVIKEALKEHLAKRLSDKGGYDGR